MKGFFVCLVTVIALAIAAGAQEAAPQASGSLNASQATSGSVEDSSQASRSQIAAGSTIEARLVKPVDARKNKVGDEVFAETTHDLKSNRHVVIPKGSKLIGHLTEVKARGKSQATSELGIAFERAMLKNGTEIPLALTIQAIGASRASVPQMEDSSLMAQSSASAGSSGGRAASSGGLVGGVRSTAQDAMGATSAVAADSVQSASSAGVVSGSLSANSHGVVGLAGLSLTTEASTSANASVISSRDSNVHLESGTEMILQVN